MIKKIPGVFGYNMTFLYTLFNSDHKRLLIKSPHNVSRFLFHEKHLSCLKERHSSQQTDTHAERAQTRRMLPFMTTGPALKYFHPSDDVFKSE